MTVYTYTTIDDPSATNGTYAFGINDLGQIVGYYSDLSNYVHGFLYSGGIYTTIDDPSATNTALTPDGINASGQITGVLPRRQWSGMASSIAGASTPPSMIPRPPTALTPLASTRRARSQGITTTPVAASWLSL